VRKEWIQVTRDALTLRFIILVLVLQLFLFGFAINTNPKNLPTGLLSADHSKYERTLTAALQNSGYYDIRTLASEAEAERALAQGEVLFVIELPANFDRSVDRGDIPSVLIDADASDPSAVGNATGALATIATVLNRDLPPVMRSQPANPAFQFVIHAR
jgi:ABC-2 type transport system permease protein